MYDEIDSFEFMSHEEAIKIASLLVIERGVVEDPLAAQLDPSEPTNYGISNPVDCCGSGCGSC